jgi:hypothetical protein
MSAAKSGAVLPHFASLHAGYESTMKPKHFEEVDAFGVNAPLRALTY